MQRFQAGDVLQEGVAAHWLRTVILKVEDLSSRGHDNPACLVFQLDREKRVPKVGNYIDVKQPEAGIYGSLKANGGFRTAEVQFPCERMLKVSLRVKQQPPTRKGSKNRVNVDHRLTRTRAPGSRSAAAGSWQPRAFPVPDTSPPRASSLYPALAGEPGLQGAEGLVHRPLRAEGRLLGL